MIGGFDAATVAGAVIVAIALIGAAWAIMRPGSMQRRGRRGGPVALAVLGVVGVFFIVEGATAKHGTITDTFASRAKGLQYHGSVNYTLTDTGGTTFRVPLNLYENVQMGVSYTCKESKYSLMKSTLSDCTPNAGSGAVSGPGSGDVVTVNLGG